METATDMMVHELDVEKWEGWVEGAKDAQTRCYQSLALCELLKSRVDGEGRDIEPKDLAALLAIVCQNLNQLEDDCQDTVNFLYSFRAKRSA